MIFYETDYPPQIAFFLELSSSFNYISVNKVGKRFVLFLMESQKSGYFLKHFIFFSVHEGENMIQFKMQHWKF